MNSSAPNQNAAGPAGPTLDERLAALRAAARGTKKWTSSEVRRLCMPEQPVLSEALLAFAETLEREEQGERCVLPKDIEGSFTIWVTLRDGYMIEKNYDTRGVFRANGDTMEKAMLNMARELRAAVRNASPCAPPAQERSDASG